MPLEHGKSKKAFSHNVEAEMHSGHPMKQSLAIAYAVKRRAQKHQKMAQGGLIKNYDDHDEKEPTAIHMEEVSGYRPMPEEHEMHNKMAMHEDKRMLNQHGKEEIGPEGHYNKKEDAPHKMAHGGMMESMRGEQKEDHELDMVGRIMKKRQCEYAHGGAVHKYSEGGSVANDTHPFEDDFDPNEFDDMVLDDHVERHQHASNEHGDEYDADHDDLVGRVMMKRRKQSSPKPA